MTYEQYAALPGLRATHIKHGATSMAHMRSAMLGEIPTASTALRFGRLFHAAVLEPDIFTRNAAVWQGGDKRSAAGAWKAFKEDHDPEWIMDSDEQAALMRMSAEVHGHPDAHRLIAGARHEVVYSWEIEGVGPCKCRLDGIGPEGIVEVKTTSADSCEQFFAQAERLGYALQFGWQRLAVQSEIKTRNVWVITVKSKPPYWVGVFQVPEQIIKHGEDEAVRIARQYRACEAMGVFPGPCSGVQEFQRPAWATGGGSVALEIGGETLEM